jgi:hypothetical protein
MAEKRRSFFNGFIYWRIFPSRHGSLAFLIFRETGFHFFFLRRVHNAFQSSRSLRCYGGEMQSVVQDFASLFERLNAAASRLLSTANHDHESELN